MALETNYFNEAQQRWLIARLGKITASNCHLLFNGGRRDMTPEELVAEKLAGGKRKTIDTLFGAGAVTYLQRLVDEMTTGEPKEEMDFRQTEWGKNNEQFAIEHFQTITGLKVNYNGIMSPEFVEYGDFAGGSPDGYILGDSALVECKCHYAGENHMKKLLIKSVDEFKEKFWEEYCQDQMNMVCTKTVGCYSISYDPRKKDPKLQMKIIRIPVDLDWQAEFEIRLNAAIDMLADIHSEIDKYLFIK